MPGLVRKTCCYFGRFMSDRNSQANSGDSRSCTRVVLDLDILVVRACDLHTSTAYAGCGVVRV